MLMWGHYLALVPESSPKVGVSLGQSLSLALTFLGGAERAEGLWGLCLPEGASGRPLSPALLPADLFDILLPMLNIYQEFVRNHQYSLQILAHCKQNRDFDKLLKHYEAKPDCEERTLETFLTYPMFQVAQPRP